MQADHVDQAGEGLCRSLSPSTSIPNDLDDTTSDESLLDKFIKLPGEAGTVPMAQGDQIQHRVANSQNSDEVDTSLGSGNDVSALGTASTFGGSEGLEAVDREAAAREVLEMFVMWPEISFALMEFTGTCLRYDLSPL